MLIIPSIDLSNGKVVRLTRGKLEEIKVYSSDPIAVARNFILSGAKLIHVVDIDAAMGIGDNRKVIFELLENEIPIQVGGGIRSITEIKKMIYLGVKRVVISTMALEEKEKLASLVNEFCDKIAVSVDYFGDKVAIHGWKKITDVSIFEHVKMLDELGLKWIILTSIKKDGTLSGADFDVAKNIVSRVKAKIIISGGISSIDEILALKHIGVSGVIIGKSIYENKIDLKKVIEVVGD